jgi:hypothetical protein
MLFLYQRIVKGLWVEKFIKPTMGLVITTFVAIYLILFCVCRPYNRMWIVFPDQGGKLRPFRAGILRRLPNKSVVWMLIPDHLQSTANLSPRSIWYHLWL